MPELVEESYVKTTGCPACLNPFKLCIDIIGLETFIILIDCNSVLEVFVLTPM